MNLSPIRMSPEMLVALSGQRKTQTRRLVTQSNSIVAPGKFADVLLDFGKLHSALEVTPGGVNNLNWSIRAPCKMPAGNRVVSIESKIRPGDLLWVRCGQQGKLAHRSASRWTLKVLYPKPFRLLDISMSDRDAEGFASRELYLAFWRHQLGRAAYEANPWVWAYLFHPMHINIDTYLAGEKPT